MEHIKIETKELVFEDIKFQFNDGVWSLFVYGEKKEEYDELYRFADNNRFYVAKVIQKELYRIINIIDYHQSPYSMYKTIRYYREDRVLVETEKSKWGFITLQYSFNGGVEIIPCVFDSLIERKDGLFDIQKDCAWGLIDLNGKIIVPTIFEKRIREDFLTYNGYSIEETSSFSLGEFCSSWGLKGLFKYENGYIKNLISPSYSDIYIPQRDCKEYEGQWSFKKRRYCNFAFCMVGSDNEHPYDEDNEAGFYACRNGFVDCFLLNETKKLPSIYQCYYLTDDGNYIFAGKNGKLNWITDDDGFSLLKSFSGSYDMIDNVGNIIVSDIGDFYYSSMDTEEGTRFVSFLNFKIFSQNNWVIMTKGYKVVKKGLPSLILNTPISIKKDFKNIAKYFIELYSNEMEETLLEYGLTPSDLKEFTHWMKESIRMRNSKNEIYEYYDNDNDEFEERGYWNIDDESYRDALDDDAGAYWNID